jgi:hypothetical protein
MQVELKIYLKFYKDSSQTRHSLDALLCCTYRYASHSLWASHQIGIFFNMGGFCESESLALVEACSSMNI